jgi:hypothetical protein
MYEMANKWHRLDRAAGPLRRDPAAHDRSVRGVGAGARSGPSAKEDAAVGECAGAGAGAGECAGVGAGAGAGECAGAGAGAGECAGAGAGAGAGAEPGARVAALAISTVVRGGAGAWHRGPEGHIAPARRLPGRSRIIRSGDDRSRVCGGGWSIAGYQRMPV